MKKVFVILSIYTLIIFACCIGETFIYKDIPQLIPTDVMNYRFFRGLFWFLSLLPAILLSGFTVACAVHWQHNTENSRQRFSPAMIERYKGVMISSLLFVFILALNVELFKPGVRDRLQAFENGPAELEEDLANVSLFTNTRKYELAYLYAERAYRTSPQSGKAAAALKLAKDNLALFSDSKNRQSGFKTVDELQKPLYNTDHQYSVRELMDRARSGLDSENWFDAHYWATLAIESCHGTDTNLSDAQAVARQAWNHLKNPEGFDNDAERLYFSRKKEGYAALDAGDYVKAYYIFLELKKTARIADPDVERFLGLSQEGLENQYFFIDETQNISLLSNSHNIYFALHNPDGTKNVFFIRNAMDTKNDGHTVRYLENLYVATYSREGDFVKLLNAPLAKVVSQPLTSFDESSLKLLGIEKKWGAVPVVMLLAVDRNTQGLVSRPSNTFKETGLPDDLKALAGLTAADGASVSGSTVPVSESDIQEEQDCGNTMILSMPYADFAVIGDASSDVNRMTVFSLWQFLRRATEYGFSEEVFAKSLVSRCTYPLFLLILFILAAAIGWNYRVEGKNILFRTSWLLLIILYGFVTYLLVEIGSYLFGILNYVLVGAFQQSALFVAFILYLIVFAVVSMHFMARKA